MNSWYWHKQGESQPRGPVSESALGALARCAELHRDDMVWHEGQKEWIQAYTVPGLFNSPPPIPADAPLPAGPSLEPEANDLASYQEPEVTVETKGATVSDVLPSPTGGQSGDDSDWYPKQVLKGVGGWLLLFCVGLTILGPLLTLSQLMTAWEEAKPAFDLYQSIETAVWLETLLLIGLIGYSFITGLMIWGENENGKQLAERYLIVRLTTFVFGALLVRAITSDYRLRFILPLGPKCPAQYSGKCFYLLYSSRISGNQNVLPLPTVP